MPLYSLVPSFRPLLAPVPRLRFRTDTHTHTDRQTDRQTHTQDNYPNPPAHARRRLITTVQCSICSQLNKKLRVVVIDIRLHHTFSIIINPRRACARITVLVLSVCLCVCFPYSGTSRNQAYKQQYQRLHRDTGMKYKKGFFFKTLRSEVMASFTHLE